MLGRPVPKMQERLATLAPCDVKSRLGIARANLSMHHKETTRCQGAKDDDDCTLHSFSRDRERESTLPTNRPEPSPRWIRRRPGPGHGAPNVHVLPPCSRNARIFSPKDRSSENTRRGAREKDNGRERGATLSLALERYNGSPNSVGSAERKYRIDDDGSILRMMFAAVV